MRYFTSTKSVFALALTVVLAGPPSFAAPPEGKGNPDKAQKHKGQKAQQPKATKAQQPKGKDVQQSGAQKVQQPKAKHSAATASGLISASEARRFAIDHNYIGYQPVPPGIRKKLARGQPLPPGIAKKMVPAPMLAQLPIRSGYEWQVYGRNLVLVAIATGIIADVLLDVFE